MVRPIGFISQLRVLIVLPLIVLSLILVSIPVASVEVKSGGQMVIEQPKEDLIISGGRVVVNAPVRGDLIVAGGEVNILNSVGGDLIAAGGRVNVGGDVGRKLIVAGGSVRINGNVGKFVIASGGEVTIGKTSKINDDVFVAGGKIENRGIIAGNFTALGGSFRNEGSITGKQIFKKAKILPPHFSEIFALGFLVLGLLLIWFDSSWFRRVNAEIKVGGTEIVKRFLMGLAGIIVSGILIVLLLITIIGIPSALLVLAAFVIGLLLSNVFVSYSIGETLISSKKQNPYLYFVTGFAILFIAFRLPYVGNLIQLVTTSLGFAGIAYVFKEWRESRKQKTDNR